jgi:hypothetical protein
VSLRVVVLAGSAALTWACASTSNRRTAPTARRPDRGSDPSTSTPAHDPDWVRTESAHSGTTAWRIPAARLAAEEDLAGDAHRAGVLTGRPVGLHLSNTLGPVTLTAYRLGYYVPITLRPADATDRLVLVSAVTSCQAYDKWGCSSLYNARDGSFTRLRHRSSTTSRLKTPSWRFRAVDLMHRPCYPGGWFRPGRHSPVAHLRMVSEAGSEPSGIPRIGMLLKSFRTDVAKARGKG